MTVIVTIYPDFEQATEDPLNVVHAKLDVRVSSVGKVTFIKSPFTS